MVSEWPERELDELCDLIVDCPHSTPKWTDKGIVVLRNQNIKGGRLDLTSPSYTDESNYEKRSRRAHLKPRDLVITREAPMGEVCMIPEGLKCCLGQRMVMLRPSRSVDERYLLYSLQSPQVQHEIHINDGTGSTVSNLRIPVLKALPIPVPPLSHQRRIAHILGTLDDKIELNRRMNQTLEAMAEAIFKSWFTDFDPVHAKAEGRDTGLPAEIADLFPSEFEESELGAIPKGWEAGSIGDVITNIRDSRKPKAIVPDDAYVGLNHFDRRCLTLWNSGHGREVTSNKSVFKEGDILFGKLRPYFHKVAIAPNDGVCSTDVLVLRANNEQWQAFASLALFQNGIIEYATQTSNGTRMPRAKWATLSTYPVALPGDMLAAEFESFVGDMLKKMRRHVAENRTLAALRDALLPKLLSGEIDVSDAEALTAEMTAAV